MPSKEMDSMRETVKALARRLKTTEHNVWMALFAISHNPAFDREVRDYMPLRGPDCGPDDTTPTTPRRK